MLKKVKHLTTRTVQSMSKNSGPGFIDPEFEPAVVQFSELVKTVNSFTDQVKSIFAMIPKIARQAGEFSTLTEKSYESFPEDEKALASQLSRMTEDLRCFLNDNMKVQAESVVSMFREVQMQLNDLKKKKDNHHDSYLILESNKSKLEGFQKKGDKKQSEAVRYQEKIEVRTAEVERLEAEFISEVSTIWSNRFQVVGAPLSAMMELIGELGSAVGTASAPVAGMLGPSFMDRDYPGEAVPERR